MGTGGSGGGGSGAGGAGTAKYNPCPDATKMGVFALNLTHAAADGTPAFSTLQGGVKSGVKPADVWTELLAEGGCRVMHGPTLTCTTPCMSGQVCMGNNVCIPEPTTHSVGTLNVTGLVVSPLALMPNNANGYNSGVALPSSAAYPPYTIGSSVGIQATGADYPAFSLSTKTIDPLELPAGQTLTLSKTQPLVINWTAPAAAGAARIELVFDIAHHGNIAAELRCELPDTGSATISAALIAKLIDQGTAGFPALTITRRSVDSTAVTPPGGCVEFAVAAGITLDLAVEGVTTCTDENTVCPAGQTCPVGPPYKCM